MTTSPSEFVRPSRRAGSGASCPPGTSPSASCMSFHVERSVAIGFSSELPLKGREKNRVGLDSLASVACCTSCWSCCAVEVGVRRVELVLADAREDQRLVPVHVRRALVEAPALPLRAALLRLVRAVEPVREDVLRHVHGDPADRVDQLLELVEVDDHDVVDRQGLARGARRSSAPRASARRTASPR